MKVEVLFVFVVTGFDIFENFPAVKTFAPGDDYHLRIDV